MKKKIVLVDMDGVLCQYDAHLLMLAHTHLGLPLHKADEVANFNTEELFEVEYRDRIDALANKEGFFKDLEPFPHAVQALHEMAHDPRLVVFICTAPKKFYKNSFCAGEKHHWIATHLGKEWTERVILTRDKTLIHGDVLIDDKPTVSGNITPSWTHVYYDRPYNRVQDKPRITSWSRWKEELLPVLAYT